MEDGGSVAAAAPASSRKRLVWVLGAIILLVIVISGIVTAIIITKGHYAAAHPLSGAIEKQAGFPLYYPSPLPTGYAYKKNSAKVDGDIVFYIIEDGNKTISVSEQAAPQNPPDLSHLPGFSTLKILAGNASIGTSLSKPVAIIASNTTLITINGTQTTPSDAIIATAKTMTSLAQ